MSNPATQTPPSTTAQATRGRIIWHELTTTDPAAAQAFYKKVVGWGTQAWENSPDYTMWMAGDKAVGGVMTLLLGFKAEFHAAMQRLERHELLATLQLLALAAVLLPLLPNRELGPWQAVNPRVVGILVLLIAGLSYVGYFAVRVLGPRLGLMLTALFGHRQHILIMQLLYRAIQQNMALAARAHFNRGQGFIHFGLIIR